MTIILKSQTSFIKFYLKGTHKFEKVSSMQTILMKSLEL